MTDYASIDIDSIMSDDVEEIDYDNNQSDRHEIENDIRIKLESLAGQLWDDKTYKRLFKKFYLITRLAQLGASVTEIKSDMEVIWEPPKSLGNNKCRDRYDTELDGLFSIAKEMMLVTRFN
ncbi:MAG: hypothetical protein V9H25_06575 [Candidatus Competibacter sp.]